MEVSWNGGTSKSSILIGFSIIIHELWGIPTYGNLYIVITAWKASFFWNEHLHQGFSIVMAMFDSWTRHLYCINGYDYWNVTPICTVLYKCVAIFGKFINSLENRRCVMMMLGIGALYLGEPDSFSQGMVPFSHRIPVRSRREVATEINPVTFPISIIFRYLLVKSLHNTS